MEAVVAGSNLRTASGAICRVRSEAMLDRLDEIIVAVSSGPGVGAAGTVRLAGPGALDLAGKVATGLRQPLSSMPGGRRTAGRLELQGEGDVPAEFFVFRAPKSFTHQDLVEIHTIGAPALLEAVRHELIRLGASAAQPGEFTARAFVGGAMDLPAAEAVAATIRARTDVQLRAARKMMDGTLAKRLREARDELAEVLALVEADIDFAEEPIEFISPAGLSARLATVTGSLNELLARATPAESIDVLPRILLLGPPNAGKSTLMNRLSGTSRAICAAVAGTTRDLLAAPMRVGRGEAILLDAAGVDESPDEIVRAARSQALTAAEQVDLVCMVIDASSPDLSRYLDIATGLDLPSIVVAANKSDLLSEEAHPEAVKAVASKHSGMVVPVSALTGDGIDQLRRGFASALAGHSATASSGAVLVSERQQAAIADAAASLARGMELAAGAAEMIDCAELLAFELREALDAIGAVTGDVTTEDLLGQVFANFCIGK